MRLYARLCGRTLARAHARSGDRSRSRPTSGRATRFDQAIADFAETYADQNERDHARAHGRGEVGRLTAQTGL